MEFDYNPVIFILAITVGIIFISLAIYFGLMIAYGGEDITIDDLEECIKQGIPPKLCIAMFYQPPLQGA